VPNEHLGAPALLMLLGEILRQAATTIETQPEAAANSGEYLRGIGARAEYLAAQIHGR